VQHRESAAAGRERVGSLAHEVVGPFLDPPRGGGVPDIHMGDQRGLVLLAAPNQEGRGERDANATADVADHVVRGRGGAEELQPRRSMAVRIVPIGKFRSLNTVRSRIGSAAISSLTRNAASMPTARTNSTTMMPESNQSCFSPRSSTSCRQPNPTTMRTRPKASIPRGFLTNGESKRNALTIRKPTKPMGRLM